MGDRRTRVIIFGHKSSGKTTALEKITQLNLEKTPHQKVEGVTTGKTVGGGRECIYETEMSSYEFLEAPSYDDHVCGMMNIAKKGDIAVLLISARDGDISEEEKLNQTIIFTHLILDLGMRNILLVINNANNEYNRERNDPQIMCINTIRDHYNLSSEIVLLPSKVSFGANQDIQNFFDGLDTFTAHGDSTPRLRIKDDDEVGLFVQKWVDVDLLLDEDPTNANHWDARARILLKFADQKWIRHSVWFTAATKANKFEFLEYTPREKEAFTLVTKGHKEAENNNLQYAKNHYEKARGIFKNNNKHKHSSCVNLIMIELEKRREKVNQEREEMEEKQNRKKSRKNKKKKNKGIDGSGVAGLEKCEEKLEVVEQEKYEEEKDEVSDVVGLKKCKEKLEVVEQEKYEKEKDEVSAKEDEKANTILHATSSSTYEISLTMSNSCGQGVRRMRNDICLTQSFIPCTNFQVNEFAEVVSIGYKKSSILTVSDIVQVKIDGEEKPFFVVEPVQSLDSYFQLKYEKWCSDEGRPEDLSWWSFIKDIFQSIYRDVIEVLLYLYLKGSACGDLFDVQNVIYITDDEHPRILPSMNPKATSVKDVEDLSKNMKAIFNLPCARGKKPLVHEFPDDLSHLFKWFKMKLSPQCVLNHYFFWKPQERIDFIFRVRKKMITTPRFMKILNRILWEDEHKKGMIWNEKVDSEGGVFDEILKKGDPSHRMLLSDDQVKEARLIKVRPYQSRSDVLRYICSVYTHYNDSKYEHYRPERLDVVGIEVKVRRLFPRIYAEVFNSLEHLDESDVMPLLRPWDKLMV